MRQAHLHSLGFGLSVFGDTKKSDLVKGSKSLGLFCPCLSQHLHAAKSSIRLCAVSGVSDNITLSVINTKGTAVTAGTAGTAVKSETVGSAGTAGRAGSAMKSEGTTLTTGTTISEPRPSRSKAVMTWYVGTGTVGSMGSVVTACLLKNESTS